VRLMPRMPDSLDNRAKAAQDGLRVHRWADLRVNVGGDGYCIKSLLPRPALALIYGASGSGKTFFASRAAFDVASGRTFLGTRTRRGRVAYIAAESPASVKRRFAAWRDREGVSDADLIVIDGRINLLSASNVDAIVSRIEAEGGASLIVIDTAAQAAAGMDENTSDGMGQVIAAMERLRDAFGACVVIVHHAGKDAEKGARGWSGLRAAVDVEVEVRGQSGTRTAHVRKMRDGEIGREINFDLRPFVIGSDDDGDPVTTCEVLLGGVESKAPLAREPKGANQRIVLDSLRQAVAEHGEHHGGSSVIPKGAKVIDADTLERYALPRLQQSTSGRNSAESRKREALNAALRSLQADARIGTWNDLRWLR
jgi:KaiC/GvpD/RAD55 family RecA-like ATPase